MIVKATRHLIALVLAALVGSTLVAPPASAAVIEDYAGYDPQTTCASSVLPGTSYLLRWLVRQYPGTGASSTLRACSGTSTSEHKDGRALDWAVDAADAKQRAQAVAMIGRILATDKKGNRHALARRMGIMYLIWNDHIYRAYKNFEKQPYLSSSCTDVRSCSKTMRHRDHVHISLSRAGAAAQTSFYRARNVRSVPVLFPGTNRLDPVNTAVVRFTVPSDGSVVRSPFKLTRGTTYRVVADGLYRKGAGSRIGDAACRWGRKGWTADGGGLLVNGTRPWTSPCNGRHTHVGSYTATRTDFMRLRIGSQTRAHSGSVTFAILRADLAPKRIASARAISGDGPRPAARKGPAAPRLNGETVTVRAAARRGVLTTRGMRKGTRYKIVATGVARSGGTRFDAGCVRYARRLRPQHTLDLTKPTADHLSLHVQGVRLSLRSPATKGACDGQRHRYVTRFKARVGGKARIKIWDPYAHADNAGALKVRIRRL